MSTTPRHDRLIELLADRACVGLGPLEQIELAELMLAFPAEDATAYDRAAAAVAIAALDELEALPPHLAARIEKEASFEAATDVLSAKHGDYAKTIADAGARPVGANATHVIAQAPPTPPQQSQPPMPSHPQPPQQVSYGPPPMPSNVVPFQRPPERAQEPMRAPMQPPPRASRVIAITGWIAAAACFALAVGALVYKGRTPQPIAIVPTASAPTAPVSVASVTPPAPKEETASALRERLLALKTTARVEWNATKDPAAKGATGDVVWNAEEQRGTMRFKGLAKNDATRAQYQLWIFDKARDDKYPVDGGVFDVDNETGDVVVAIKAKLPVDKPTLFAVTVEKPGGVVVSKRERIVVTAKLPAG